MAVLNCCVIYVHGIFSKNILFTSFLANFYYLFPYKTTVGNAGCMHYDVITMESGDSMQFCMVVLVANTFGVYGPNFIKILSSVKPALKHRNQL